MTRTGETMRSEIAQATAENAYGIAVRAMRRAGWAMVISGVALVVAVAVAVLPALMK